MQISQILSSALSFLLVTVMLGIGLMTDFADFKQVLKNPKAIFVGLFCQALLLPAMAFAFCTYIPLPPEFKIGFILLAASPGGPSSNIYSLLARGDIALNLSLTAINSLTNLVTMPFFAALAISLYEPAGGHVTSMPFDKFKELCLLVIVPAAVGLFIRNQKPKFAQKSAAFIKILSVVLLSFTVTALVYLNWLILLENSKSFGVIILIFNLLSLGIAYGAAKLARLSRPQAISIGFEAGIHNGSLALYIAVNVLRNQAYAIPATIYSVLMYFTAGAVLLFLRRQNSLKH